MSFPCFYGFRTTTVICGNKKKCVVLIKKVILRHFPKLFYQYIGVMGRFQKSGIIAVMGKIIRFTVSNIDEFGMVLFHMLHRIIVGKSVQPYGSPWAWYSRL